jgi:hypothetical protein
MDSMTPEQTLRIYHEMFALVDEETEPERMAEIVAKIRTLEKQMGNLNVDLGRLNTAVFRRAGQTTILKSSEDPPPQTTEVEPAEVGKAHRIYLQGVTAMNEGRWTEARTCLNQVKGYRRADTFLLTLDGLDEEKAPKGKPHGKPA